MTGNKHTRCIYNNVKFLFHAEASLIIVLLVKRVQIPDGNREVYLNECCMQAQTQWKSAISWKEAFFLTIWL